MRNISAIASTGAVLNLSQKRMKNMMYFRTRFKITDYFTGYEAKRGELFTEKERNSKVRFVDDFYFEKVEISKSKVYKTADNRRFQFEERILYL